LRNRSRSLIRDNDYARNIKRLIQNNVIGQGVSTQCTVKKSNDNLNDKLNNEIESVWLDWCKSDNCDVAGKLHFHDMERLIMGSLMENGEAIIRIVKQSVGREGIPLALELIEPDRLVNQNVVVSPINQNNSVRMGVEVNEFGRPQYYHFYAQAPTRLLI
jgi:lambda family phage portal protein